MAVDVLDNPIYRMLHLKWSSRGCRTIIYAVTVEFYEEYLYGRYKEIRGYDGGFWGAEGLMRSVWEQTKDMAGVYPRFRTEPRLSGYAGALNCTWITANNYDGLLAMVKRGIRQICRWVLPFLWL